MDGPPTLTASQVKKAGRVLRQQLRGEPVDLASISWALDVLVAHRAGHALPLKKADMGLRSMVRSEAAAPC